LLLAWDERVPHFPQGPCACGADLAAGADLGVAASYQILDVPLQTATVTQHDRHEVACRCGRVHRAPAPGQGAPRGTVT
jgi:transposase